MPTWEIKKKLTVQLRAREGNQHHTPHCHVKCGGDEAVYNLTGKRMNGILPPGTRKLVSKWIIENHEMLISIWNELRKGEGL